MPDGVTVITYPTMEWLKLVLPLTTCLIIKILRLYFLSADTASGKVKSIAGICTAGGSQIYQQWKRCARRS